MEHASMEGWNLPLMSKLWALLRAHYILVALGYISLRIVYLLWLHPLSTVPGPRFAALTDLWKTNAVRKRRFNTTLHRLHKNYGDVIRIGPNEVTIIAPDEVQTIYGYKSEYYKGPSYNTWDFDEKTHFSDRDPVTHAQRRRSVAAAYAINHLPALENYCDTCTELLFGHFDKAADCGAISDINSLINWYTLDCVSAIGFGKDFGLLKNGGDSTGVTGIVADATQILSILSTLSNFTWIIPTKPFSWLVSTIMGDKGLSFLLKYGAKYVIPRQALRESDPAAFAEQKDMLYQFMVSKDPVSSQPLDTRALISNTLVIIVAGADTTRSAMVAILACIYSHTSTLERLRNEINDAILNATVSLPITYAQAARLEFLGACIKEAMRLHPAVGMPLQRVVPKGGRTIAGRFYPGGTLIGMVPRDTHRDPRAYGRDASEWRPDRWLEGDRTDLEKPNLVWGAGSRACLGKNISLMKIFKLIPSIIHNYDLKIVNPGRPYEVSESWFTMPTEFLCSVKKRVHV